MAATRGKAGGTRRREPHPQLDPDLFLDDVELLDLIR
jgi:hypothetical protein